LSDPGVAGTDVVAVSFFGGDSVVEDVDVSEERLSAPLVVAGSGDESPADFLVADPDRLSVL
jgi:hypothetical protein